MRCDCGSSGGGGRFGAVGLLLALAANVVVVRFDLVLDQTDAVHVIPFVAAAVALDPVDFATCGI